MQRGSSMTTIYEVSERAGVSVATVSRVMNNSGKVSPKTRQAVIDAMQELDYRPNAIARSLAANRSGCVGILVSELHGPIFGTMLTSIESELRGQGKVAIFAAGHSDRDRELEGIRSLADMNCDALILHVEALSDADLLDLHRERPTPIVVINRDVKGMEEACITLDNHAGGFAATEAMLTLGHRDIAYISGPLSFMDAQDRLAGHRRALREAGVEADPALIVEGDYHEQGGVSAMERLMDSGRPFSAVICGNDEMAAGAMFVARSRGLSLPEDLSVMGYDNVRWARYLYPKLSTVNYPVANMATMAARWVLKHVYEQADLEIRNRFKPTLVFRDSTAALEDTA